MELIYCYSQNRLYFHLYIINIYYKIYISILYTIYNFHILEYINYKMWYYRFELKYLSFWVFKFENIKKKIGLISFYFSKFIKVVKIKL